MTALFTELNYPEQTCNKSTELHGTFIGHAAKLGRLVLSQF